MEDIIIIGAGGFGKEVAWLIERINQKSCKWNILGFVDDGKEVGKKINQYYVLGNLDYLKLYSKKIFVVCALGNVNTRKAIIQKIKSLSHIFFATLIDPSVIVSNTVTIGEGSILCATTILTVNIAVGKHVIINLDCTIGHDVIIKDYCTLYPSVNVSGKTYIGEFTEVGTGVNIIQGMKIANKVILGAGSVVVKNIEQSGTYTGIPAKRIG